MEAIFRYHVKDGMTARQDGPCRIYIFIYIHICMYIHIYIYIHIYTHTRTYIYIYIYIYTHIFRRKARSDAWTVIRSAQVRAYDDRA